MSLVENGDLKYTEIRLINRLMRTVKESDNDPASRLKYFQLIHKDMEQTGIKKTQEQQNYLIEAYLDNNMIDKARVVFDEINRWEYLGKRPVGKLVFCNAFNMMINAYGMRSYRLEKEGKPGTKSEDLREVTKLFTLMHEKNLIPNGTTKTILKNIFRYHFDNNAISWIRELRKKGIVDAGLEKEILIILLENHNIKEAIRFFGDMKERNLVPDVYSYIPLIHQLAQHGKVEESLKLIEEMKERNVPLNTVAYNVLIGVYNMASNYEQAGQLIENMLKQNIEPNIRTFGQLINTYAKAGKSDLALQVLKMMTKFGIQPNEYIYTSMIELFANLSDIQSMENVFRRMVDSGISPKEVTYYILLMGYSRVQDLNKSFQTCRLMIKSGIEPNVRTYNALISLFAQKGDTTGAHMLFHEMQQFGISPDVYTYTSLINAYVNSSNIRGAESLFSEMKKGRIKPLTTTYNVLMSYYVGQKDIYQVQQIFDEMIRERIQPDNFTYCCLMDGFCSQNDLESAVSLMNNLQKNKMKPDAQIYTVLIHAYMRNGNFLQAKRLYEDMIQNGVYPTFVTYAILIDGHARIGELDFARKLLTELISQSTKETVNQSVYKDKTILNPDIFTPLMDAYAKQGQTEAAWEIFEEMITLGVKHNLHVYTILMSAYYRGRNYEAVWKMWKVMSKNITSSSIFSTNSKIYEQLKNLDFIESQTSEEDFSMTLAESKWSSSLLISFSLLYSSISVIQPPPNQAVSIMIETLTAAKKFKAIELEWRRLDKGDFEFDCVNYNHYIQSLIISGKIKLACKLLDEHLIKGWERGLALSNIYKEKFSIQSINYRQELLKNSSKFYPHKKTLLLLAKYFENINFEINQGKNVKKHLQNLKEFEDEFPEIVNITREFFESWKLNHQDLES
ncbi:2029_t:CDS:1 [Funneliformis geosporum]|uniref:3612_t:CDS:1 n=1 Tax=Funneliformis geosporum TaxID=1117311 RepID=A0A9W4SPS7_9GLOM|nr:2029_t:CDS:1 [Funneliformis geosporum]CAI2177194.1 3612_t:CDS:1 [Funneliformis geosporum]